MTTTQTQQPPPTPPIHIAAGFSDDEVRALGDRIAALTLPEAQELYRYLQITDAQAVHRVLQPYVSQSKAEELIDSLQTHYPSQPVTVLSDYIQHLLPSPYQGPNP